MNNLGDLFSICFVIAPGRRDFLLNAWSSMTDLDPPPTHAILMFNPSDQDADFFFDIQDIRNSQILKFDQYNPLSFCWNLAIVLTSTPYVIFANDDIIHLDEKLLEKVYKKHQEGYKLVHCTEASSYFSIHKSLILDIGWWDHNFIHSFEDCSMRYSMERKNIRPFRFEPHLVRHLRCGIGRDEEKWHQSSEYMFRKWGIHEHIGLKEFPGPNQRKLLQARGLFRQINSKDLTEVIPTPNYFPETLEYIRKNFPWEYNSITDSLAEIWTNS